ncbi:2Fe-2S iron-sulfur cluster binding domain protein [Synechococcus sp. PCC 7335]|nr:2Fe-2S iron-sulfur cluster binding domain protein [Synechococcus sp. PCC 7335]
MAFYLSDFFVSVQIRFLPDNITTTAEPGEALLDVAHRVGVHISTGCLMGSCYACEVEMTSSKNDSDISVRACLTAVPDTTNLVEINLLDDPTW